MPVNIEELERLEKAAMDGATFNRLIKHIRVDRKNGCWEWTGRKTDRGYGLTHITKARGIYKSTSAHRIMAIAMWGEELVEGLIVCHKCDNPPCINPTHLFTGTQSDNMQDMLRKGRGHIVKTEEHKRRLSNSLKAYCEDHEILGHPKKLNAEQVREIRTISGITQRKIAEMFGVEQTLISQIKRRKIWKKI